MTNEQFEHEKNYQISISLIKSMLQKDIISKEEYKKIDKILIQKHKPILSSLNS